MRHRAVTDKSRIDCARLVITLALALLLGVPDLQAGNSVSAGTYIWLRTRKRHYMNTCNGTRPGGKPRFVV